MEYKGNNHRYLLLLERVLSVNTFFAQDKAMSVNEEMAGQEHAIVQHKVCGL